MGELIDENNAMRRPENCSPRCSWYPLTLQFRTPSGSGSSTWKELRNACSRLVRCRFVQVHSTTYSCSRTFSFQINEFCTLVHRSNLWKIPRFLKNKITVLLFCSICVQCCVHSVVSRTYLDDKFSEFTSHDFVASKNNFSEFYEVSRLFVLH